MRKERMLAIVLASLFVLVSGISLANANQVALNSEIINSPEKGWYGAGDIVEINAQLINTGDATSISIDPSCDYVLRIWYGSEIIVDGSDSCFGQNRGLDIGSSSTLSLDTLTWDLRNSNGEFVQPGEYQIEYYIPNAGLSSINSIQVQTPIEIPEALELEVIATARDGNHKVNSPSVITVRIVNTIGEEISLNTDGCKLNLNQNLLGHCGKENYKPYEISTIAQFTVVPELGENFYNISLGDEALKHSITINAVENVDLMDNFDQFENLDVDLDYTGDDLFYELDNFDSELVMSNIGSETIIVNFTKSCRGEIWVVDQLGEVVRDSRNPNDCVEMDTQNIIPASENRKVVQQRWSFIDENNCMVTPGNLLVIGEMPQLGKYDTETISFDYESRANCQTQSLQLNTQITNHEDFTIESTLIAPEGIEITWFSQCDFDFTLLNMSAELFGAPLNCEDNETFSTRFINLQIEDIKLDMENYEDGTYFIKLESTSEPRFSVVSSFEWISQTNEIDEPTDAESEEVQSRFVAGTWSSTETSAGTCWFLNTPDEGIVTLNSAPGLIEWSPAKDLVGQYKVVDSSASPQCSEFSSPSIIIEQVMSEEMPQEVVEEEQEVQQNVQPVEEVASEVSPIVVGVSAVVVSTGVLSLLVAFVSTNESLRIPATTAGLWLLGLIGKTNETSDGRYQRGRLMGYLTANPGCHFRALMAALDMSNGQITHHLKILEDEDRIWRKPDGRLVRFYPYTSNLHPGLEEGELPMPPLSPDPNSLQGKILKLLDDDGTMNKFPTQVDLAHRLDKSQQLISHHLRTLENYGLVEKRRSGVKNRYNLTKEALFLLESTDY